MIINLPVNAPPVQPVLQPNVSLSIRYVVFSWRGMDGPAYQFDGSPSGFCNKAKVTRGYDALNTFSAVVIPIDPFTALSQKLVTFDEIEMPEALRAYYNIVHP